MHGFYDYNLGIGHLTMMLFWIAIIGLIIWGIFTIKIPHKMDRESPLDIAKRRYANGEISKQELEEIKRHL